MVVKVEEADDNVAGKVLGLPVLVVFVALL